MLGASGGPRPGALSFCMETIRLTQVRLTVQGPGHGGICHQAFPQGVGGRGEERTGSTRTQAAHPPHTLDQERWEQPRPPGREDWV